MKRRLTDTHTFPLATLMIQKGGRRAISQSLTLYGAKYGELGAGGATLKSVRDELR
jgi:hypothetical protein